MRMTRSVPSEYSCTFRRQMVAAGSLYIVAEGKDAFRRLAACGSGYFAKDADRHIEDAGRGRFRHQDHLSGSSSPRGVCTHGKGVLPLAAHPVPGSMGEGKYGTDNT